MRKGFSHGVAPKLIQEHPGLTARRIAEIALEEDLAASDSKDPVNSLAQTLAKEVREGRLPEVRTERVSGILRLFPADMKEAAAGIATVPTISYSQLIQEDSVSVRLPKPHIEIADSLVEVGQHRNRSEALAWLVAEGIGQNRARLEKVKSALEQIREIKRNLKT